MRSDAASLLHKLSLNDFRYREFDDAFSDMELWPLFEALLTDVRIVGKPKSVLDGRRPDVSRPRPVAREAVGGVFAAYDTPSFAGASSPAAVDPADARAFLGRLSGRGTRKG